MGESGAGNEVAQLTLNQYSRALLDAVCAADIGVIVLMDDDGEPRSIHVSDTALRILRRTRDDFLGRTLFDFIAGDEVERLREQRQRRLAGAPVAAITETVAVRGDGTRVPIAYVRVEPTFDTGRGHVVFFWDIGKRLEEESRLRRVIEAAPDGIVISRRGVVLEANPAAAKMLGHDTPAELVGVSLHSLMSPVDVTAMTERVAAVHEGALLTPRVYEARRKDGTRVLAEITSVTYEHGGEPAVLGFARDVTYRERLEAQLVQSERMVALGTLAAGVAHEVNNPLAIMSLSLEQLNQRLQPVLAASDAGTRDGIHAIVADLRDGLDRAAGVVRELRAFSQGESAPPGPTDLLHVLSAADRMTMPQLRHQVNVRTEYGVVPLVVGHAQKLQQVFVNLLINAAQAMPEGRAENSIVIRTHAVDDQNVVVEVVDNGAGMEESVRRRAFDPFFTTKMGKGGTGLGLSISHGIVAQLGGSIEIESKVGVGSTVRVTLKAAPHSLVSAKAEGPSARLARTRTLIIDDEKSLVTTLRYPLIEEHDVVTATSGADACALLQVDHAFDVVLCDIMMPGMSGMDVYAWAEGHVPDLCPRFVFMTGGAVTDRASQFLANHTNPVLEKPFPLSSVQRVMSQLQA